MVKHFLLMSLCGCIAWLFPTNLQATTWEQFHDTYILSDATREVNCAISHPRQQIHLYRVQLFVFENNSHQEYSALVVYRHERYSLIEGSEAYVRFLEDCGLPEKYQKWFP